MSLTILVADDEPAIVRTVTRLLERAGHDVYGAATAAEAMDLLDRLSFDVALVDAHMPGDGRTVLRALADRPDFTGRMYLMTGSLPEEVEDLPPGTRRLQKPFDVPSLAALLEADDR